MEQVYQDKKAGITIYHGDAFQLMPTLAPRQAALVLTDIPYGPDTQKGARTNKAGMGDKSPIGFGAFTEEQVLQAFWEFSRLSYRWVVSTVDWQHALPLKKYAQEVDLRFIRTCTWVKTNGMPQKTADRPAQGSETIVYMHDEETPLRWHGGGRHGNFYGPVVRETGHPTEKPRWMISQLIQLFTDPGDLVIDPFMGSGTVLRCAKDLGRRAIGIELDRRWCDSTIHRLAQESLPLIYLPPVE